MIKVHELELLPQDKKSGKFLLNESFWQIIWETSNTLLNKCVLLQIIQVVLFIFTLKLEHKTVYRYPKPITGNH